MINVENPWKNISPENFIADCDKETLEKLPSSKRDKIQTNTFPEPFAGNKDSKVYCLNLNPGEIDTEFEINDSFIKEVQLTLGHNTNELMWLKENTDKNGKIHEGCKWWQKRTNKLRDVLGKDPDIFILEYFPYHSKKGFDFPELPSNSYRNQLLKDAIENGKLILVMRGAKRWYSIKEDGIGKILENYKNKIEFDSWQASYFTPNNLKNGKWEILLDALQ